jgi:mannose-6-phosphate isomerase
MTLERADREPLVADVVERCRKYRGRFERECEWAVRLADRYPGDAGVVSSLLVNLVRLEPGDGLYLGAGNLHAHLHGVGVEVMASSDNVLRGGLTPKHVDVPELLRVLDFGDGPASVVRPRRVDARSEVWDTPAAEFQMSRLTVSGETLTCDVSSPELVLCVEGRVELRAAGEPAVELSSGAAAFIRGSGDRYTVSGAGQAFRATTNR